MHKIPDKYRAYFIYLTLATATLAVFWQVHSFEFTSCDDDDYVSKNNHILSGLTTDNVIWVFTKEHVGNWHPLTGLSHMLDCQLFGPKPGWHHLVNLLFHIANTLLLFTVLRQMTGALWQSAFVAALFALHPVNVESVAWISERKNVLSTLFLLLTMAAYLRYVENPGIGRYTLTIVLFALGLMSKPMLVTLPFVLLLLDYWPLNRLESNQTGKTKRQVWQHLIWEKVPFFILSTLFSIITFFVQRSAGAVRKLGAAPIMSRIANALFSYLSYIGKMIWPVNLSVYYTHVGNKVPQWQVFAVAILLMIVTISVICLGAKYRYLVVGWFWYIGTLVPVIGLIQVGDQGMADRYAYIPLIGLFIIIAWATNEILGGWRYRKAVLGTLSTAVILILSVLTWFQTNYWRNDRSLFGYAMKANNNFCMTLLDNGKFYQEAIEACKHTIKIEPDCAGTYNILGFAYSKIGHYQDAIEVYHKAIKIQPTAEVYNNLGVAHIQLGHFEEAAENYKQAIRIKPDYAEAYNNIGAVYNQLGQHQEAVEVYKQAIRLKPDYVNAHYNLGLTYLTAGDSNSAAGEYKILKTLDAETANKLLSLIHK